MLVTFAPPLVLRRQIAALCRCLLLTGLPRPSFQDALDSLAMAERASGHFCGFSSLATDRRAKDTLWHHVIEEGILGIEEDFVVLSARGRCLATEPLPEPIEAALRA